MIQALILCALLAGGASAASNADMETVDPSKLPPPPEKEPPRGPMSLADARINYSTIVENYILERSPKEFMPLKDKAGRLWKLRLETIDVKPMRQLKPDVFVSCAQMRDGPNRLDVDFTVDFSGDRWRVAAVHLHRVNGKPRFEYKGAQRVPVK